MKNLLVGLLLALTPSVAISENQGQDLIVADLQDIGVLIIGHTSGCGVADFENIRTKVGSLAVVYNELNGRDIAPDLLKTLVTSELEYGAEIGGTIISDEGCFRFNQYIVKYRHELNTIDDVFTLYVPTSGV